MNEKLAELLIKYIDKASGFVEKAIDLAIDEVPKVIQEYLAWGAWDAGISIIIKGIFLGVCIFCFYLLYKAVNNKKNSDDDNDVFSVFVFVLTTIIGFLLYSIIDNIKTVIKINVAPRVYLIEKASELYEDRKDKK